MRSPPSVSSSIRRNGLAIVAVLLCFLPNHRGVALAQQEESATGIKSYAVCQENLEQALSETASGTDVNGNSYSRSSNQNRLLCDCQPQPGGEYMLLCSLYDNYSYCGPQPNNREICASIMFGQIIDGEGNVSKRFRNFDQIQGKATPVSTIVVEQNLERCLVFIDGVACNKCETVVDCPAGSPADYFWAEISGFTGVLHNKKIDCTNVYSDATFDCGVGEDALSLLNGRVLPNGETFPPLQTLPPYLPPTVAPAPTNPPTTIKVPVPAPVPAPAIVPVPATPVPAPTPAVTADADPVEPSLMPSSSDGNTTDAPATPTSTAAGGGGNRGENVAVLTTSGSSSSSASSPSSSSPSFCIITTTAIAAFITVRLFSFCS